MTDIFAHCPSPEPSSLLGFSQNEIKSNVEHRSPQCLSAAMDNPDSRWIAHIGGQILGRQMDKSQNAFHIIGELEQFNPDFTNAILLGDLNGSPILAVTIKTDIEKLDAPYQLMDTRELLFAPNLPPHQAGAAGMALSLSHWHHTNQFCGKCGAPSFAQIGGMRRDCSKCHAQIFPRTDPAVIMLAIRENQCLLGRSPKFPPLWYSCLAGFVEPGETFEQAVRRETMEESGIKIGRVKYFASQPWPFPHSLMIGAYCEALSHDINFDGEELEDCRWFDRDEVLAMIEKRHQSELRAPPSSSIAAHIIGNWLKHSA